MDGIAIAVGWFACTTLLMVPPEVCLDTDHARFIGGAALMLAALVVFIPSTIWLAGRVTHAPDSPVTPRPAPKQPYRPLPPMPGPVRQSPSTL